MEPKQIMNLLKALPLGSSGNSAAPGTLRYLAFVIGGDLFHAAKYANKLQVISLLCEFYCTPGRFQTLWSGLSEAERKMIALHVWSGGSEPQESADEVARLFGLDKKTDGAFYRGCSGLEAFQRRYAEEKSRLWLLFPDDKHWPFPQELRAAVGEMEREYSEVTEELDFTSRAHRAADFTKIIRFCNANKLKVTKSGMISKSSALKLRDYCGYEEYAAHMEARPEDVRGTAGLLVTLPLTVLCITGGLIACREGVYVPGPEAVSLLGLPQAQLIKRLLEAYLKSRSFDEISLLKGIAARQGHNPALARRNLVEELKYCPIDQAVYAEEFEWFLQITNSNFARKAFWEVTDTGGYYGGGADWGQYEHPLIQTILSFLGALGLIDIAWDEDLSQYSLYYGLDQPVRRVPAAFKINRLGAYVLGLSSDYHAPEEAKPKAKGGFTVLPDYTIVVPESADRLKHELYFEKLFTILSATDEASIYRLDFETVARVLDGGGSVAGLRSYLLSSDKPLPENVAGALDDWERQASRITIRRVTILECDDPALLEEVIRYRGMGEWVKEKIPAAAVIEENAVGKIKKVIEKNKRFCRNDI